MKDKYQAVLRWMDGNKTYLGAIGYGLLGIFWGQNWISDDYAKVIAGLLTTWTGFAIRSAIKKSAAGANITVTLDDSAVQSIGKAHADETMAKWEEAGK